MYPVHSVYMFSISFMRIVTERRNDIFFWCSAAREETIQMRERKWNTDGLVVSAPVSVHSHTFHSWMAELCELRNEDCVNCPRVALHSQISVTSMTIKQPVCWFSVDIYGHQTDRPVYVDINLYGSQLLSNLGQATCINLHTQELYKQDPPTVI
jgi:hypothetical protein